MAGPSVPSFPSAGPPPGSWSPARRWALKALRPVERFLAIEAASGVLLLLAAAVALSWANSPFRESYLHLLHTPLGLRIGAWSFERDLHFWINDGLMTIFFFVVGLEIRREIHRGELSDLRRAALPLAAALGGMLLPAIIYLGFNLGQPTQSGWGVPMATDIAFAVGVLTLLGPRVPPALRVLLLALAVIDDVGAILVIALFYSTGLAPVGFLMAGLGVGGILLLQSVGVRSAWAYVPAGVVIWAGLYTAGIHPTLAGVVVGLMTPVRAWLAPEVLIDRVRSSAAQVEAHQREGEAVLLAHVGELQQAREGVSPVERLQHVLHGWVAYGVMPVFALANAGVTLGAARFEGESWLGFLGITAGLLLGKPLGVLGLSFLATRLGLASLPVGVTWARVAVVGVTAGIGFTMSIFMAELAFPAGATLQTAKVAILVGSLASALLAYGLGRAILGSPIPGAAITESEAEGSTTT